MMTPAQIEAWDRRTAAVHEAGHIVIATHFGYSAWGEIRRNANGSVDPHREKLWLGSMSYRSAGSGHQALIAVAGRVAELAWRGEDDDEIFWFEPEVMSHSDWRLADCHPGEPKKELLDAVQVVATLLERRRGELWTALCATARELIEEERER